MNNESERTWKKLKELFRQLTEGTEEKTFTRVASLRGEIRSHILRNMTKQIFTNSSTTFNFPLLIKIVFDNFYFILLLR
jgi:hypothetical protein